MWKTASAISMCVMYHGIHPRTRPMKAGGCSPPCEGSSRFTSRRWPQRRVLTPHHHCHARIVGHMAHRDCIPKRCVSEPSDQRAPVDDHSVMLLGTNRGGSSETLGKAPGAYAGSTNVALTWVVEATANDRARLVSSTTSGKQVTTDEGLYVQPFRMVVVK